MSPTRLVQLLTEATHKWVSVRACYETLVFKCLSVMREDDTVRIEAELKIDTLREVPPQREVSVRFVEDSPIVRTTIVIEPETVTSVCIFQGLKARPNDH
jgi:hypothetical protein